MSTTTAARRAVATLGPPVDVEYAPRWKTDHHPWLVPGGVIRYSNREVREYDDPSKPLRWRKSQGLGGGYLAEDDVNRYVVERSGALSWQLRVFRLTVTAGVRHTLGATAHAHAFAVDKATAVAVAAAYRALGEDYRPAEHGARNRMTEAIGRAHDAMDAAPAVGMPRWRPEWERSTPHPGLHGVEGHELRHLDGLHKRDRAWWLHCPILHRDPRGITPLGRTLAGAVEAFADHLAVCRGGHRPCGKCDDGWVKPFAPTCGNGCPTPGPHAEPLPESACEGCGTALPSHNDNDKCDECLAASTCRNCGADVGTDVGTVEIGGNNGRCRDCGSGYDAPENLDDAPEWTL